MPTGGWDAALSFWQGQSLMGRDLWHSSDGLRWTQLEPAPALEGQPELPWVHAGAADAQGIRVLWQGWTDFKDPDFPTGVPVMTLATSPDGRSWTTVDGFAGEGTDITGGVAPDGVHSRWVLAGASGIGTDYSSSVPTVWTSEDGVKWMATVLPTTDPPALPEEEPQEEHGRWPTSVELTRAGYVAVASGWWGAQPYAAWLSEDGVAWVELPPVATPEAKFGPGVVADGPAGVIGIGVSPTDPDQEVAVWELR